MIQTTPTLPGTWFKKHAWVRDQALQIFENDEGHVIHLSNRKPTGAESCSILFGLGRKGRVSRTPRWLLTRSFVRIRGLSLCTGMGNRIRWIL